MSVAVPAVPVFMPHWNRPDECAASLDTLLAQTVPVRVTVLDNASDAGARDQLAACASERVSLRWLDRNLGFGPAANVALREWLASGEGEWAAIAAHDARLAPDCIERLVEALRAHPRAGIVSAEQGFPHAARFSGWRGPWLPPHPRGAGFEAQDFPHGTLLMVRRACAEQIGLFDERYFAYGDEMEWGLRARRVGWDVGIVWGAMVRNPGRSVASPVASYLQVRNALVLVKEWKGPLWLAWRSGISLANTVRLQVLPSRRPAAFSGSARLRAIADAWIGRLGPPPASVSGTGGGA